MATERLPMRQIREILRLKWTLQRSHRETARSLGVSAAAITSSPKTSPHSSKPLFDVSTVEARS